VTAHRTSLCAVPRFISALKIEILSAYRKYENLLLNLSPCYYYHPIQYYFNKNIRGKTNSNGRTHAVNPEDSKQRGDCRRLTEIRQNYIIGIQSKYNLKREKIGQNEHEWRNSI
jgi:hypothetical protein